MNTLELANYYVNNKHLSIDFDFLSEHIITCNLSGCNYHYGLPLIETYEKLYKGEAVEFDLCKGKAIFKHESNFQINFKL